VTLGCNCNNHATSCKFDKALYAASGNVSGGYCENCLHNTMGPKCSMCKRFFYLHPEHQISDIDACHSKYLLRIDPGRYSIRLNKGLPIQDASVIRGVLWTRGFVILIRIRRGIQLPAAVTVNFTRQDRNVTHAQWVTGIYRRITPKDAGVREYLLIPFLFYFFLKFKSYIPWNLACSCNTLGTEGNQGCNMNSGSCTCKTYVTGRDCEQCLPGYWGLSEDPDGCKPCDCDVGGSYHNNCDVFTGKCRYEMVLPNFYDRRLITVTFWRLAADPMSTAGTAVRLSRDILLPQLTSLSTRQNMRELVP